MWKIYGFYFFILHIHSPSFCTLVYLYTLWVSRKFTFLVSWCSNCSIVYSNKNNFQGLSVLSFCNKNCWHDIWIFKKILKALIGNRFSYFCFRSFKKLKPCVNYYEILSFLFKKNLKQLCKKIDFLSNLEMSNLICMLKCWL